LEKIHEKISENTYWPSQKIKIIFHVSTSLRLRPVFGGAEEPGISSVKEPRGKLEIFRSPRAYIKGDR